MTLNVKDKIAEVVETAMRQAVADGALGDGELPVPKIEYPREEKFGDYSTPVAMESARVLKRSPLEIGAVLKGYIERSEIAGAVDVAKPGFINIFLNPEFLYRQMEEILAERDLYGRQTKKNPRRISVEFISANPTGPLNIVSARAAAVGDTLANLLEACGDSVDREFYINDYGNQVLLLGRSVLCRYREIEGEAVEFPEDGYHGEYVRDIAAFIRDNFAGEVLSVAGEDALMEFMARKAVEYNVSGQRRDLERFNVNFRRWFNESLLHEDGSVLETFRTLEKLGVIYEEDGKKVFRSTEYGDDKDRVVVRDDGRPTYLLADIAYHRNKKDRGYDLIINIWGPDHHGYIARLAGAMKAMGCPEGAFRV
ncbi:MAG: arginine--tRNA ligase, partial [Spirochaetales bacterium]